jgi:hypothetical protein
MLLRQQARPPTPMLSREFLTEDHGTRIIIIMAVITGVSFLVVSLRFYVRAVMLKTVGSDDYTVSKLVLVEQNSTNFVSQMMLAMVNPIFLILSTRSLTFAAFCSWGVRLFSRGSEARSWTPKFGHLLGSCSCSKSFEGCRMVMDPLTVQFGGHILRQDISRIVPT